MTTPLTPEQAFDQWYAENAFDYVRDPIGSREYGLQKKAWLAATHRAAQSAQPEAVGAKLSESERLIVTQLALSSARPTSHVIEYIESLLSQRIASARAAAIEETIVHYSEYLPAFCREQIATNVRNLAKGADQSKDST